MQGFFQTPDPNPNHTVGWETLRPLVYEKIARRVRNHGFVKNADAIKNTLFFCNFT